MLEENDEFREEVKTFLVEQGYGVEAFSKGEAVLESILEENTFDMLLIDTNIPDISGYSILKRIREEDIEIPVIFLTSSSNMENLSKAYELGCNDYIRKPFEFKELKYRILQTMSCYHFNSMSKSIKLADNFIFNVEKSELYLNNIPINLTPIEQKILELLIKRRGFFSQTSDIISTIWHDDFISEADLRMHIKRIRDKTSKNLILNSRGLGYKIERL